MVIGRKKTTILINVVRFANKNYRMIINSIKDFMKKNTPNLILELLSNLIYIQRLLTLTVKRVSIVIPFTFFCITISAQNGNSATTVVKELDIYLSTLKVIDQNKCNHIESLLYNLQPSIYFYSGEVKTYGEKPNTLYTDVNSMQNVDNTSILKENIEIVNLKITNTNEKIDLSKFSNYTNLKYIYVVSKINLTDQTVMNMIHNYDEKYIIFYKTLEEE